MTTHNVLWTRQHTTDWIKEGALGGLIGGIVFAMFQMIMAAILDGGNAFWNPLRMIGGIVLGADALDHSYSLAKAAIVGGILHMMLSIVFGIIFGVIVSIFPTLARSGGTLIASAAVFGVALWLVNFYAIAPAADWNWFPDKSRTWVQFIAHLVFFGVALGLVVNAVAGRNRVREG